MTSSRKINESAYRAVIDELRSRFPRRHFVAFDDGEMVANAASFDDLTSELVRQERNRKDVFVAQVGVDYPEEVSILM